MHGRGSKPELIPADRMQPPSPLMQGRGSKRELMGGGRDRLRVAPHAGAWIETTAGRPGRAWSRSPLMQGRGSKPLKLKSGQSTWSRPSCRGVDRNEVFETYRAPQRQSPLMQGRGSKLFSYVPTANGGAVAHTAGEWIETGFICPDRKWWGGRPSCRGVDRKCTRGNSRH